MDRLTDRIAVVSGAANGIGRASALRLAREGADLVVIDREADPLASVARAIEGFGRRELQFSPNDVEDFVAYQVGALAAIAAAQGVRLQHVKPHGALFNMAVRDASIADAIARAAAVIDPALILFGLPESEIVAAGKRAGLRTANEGFADRAYRPA